MALVEAKRPFHLEWPISLAEYESQKEPYMMIVIHFAGVTVDFQIKLHDILFGVVN